MKDKLNITIRIADQPRMYLSIPPEEEEVVRRAEANINELWRNWTKRFKDKTPGEILAMVAFRFAQLYFNNEARVADVDSTLASLEKDLDERLLAMEADE